MTHISWKRALAAWLAVGVSLLSSGVAVGQTCTITFHNSGAASVTVTVNYSFDGGSTWTFLQQGTALGGGNYVASSSPNMSFLVQAVLSCGSNPSRNLGTFGTVCGTTVQVDGTACTFPGAPAPTYEFHGCKTNTGPTPMIITLNTSQGGVYTKTVQPCWPGAICDNVFCVDVTNSVPFQTWWDIEVYGPDGGGYHIPTDPPVWAPTNSPGGPIVGGPAQPAPPGNGPGTPPNMGTPTNGPGGGPIMGTNGVTGGQMLQIATNLAITIYQGDQLVSGSVDALKPDLDQIVRNTATNGNGANYSNLLQQIKTAVDTNGLADVGAMKGLSNMLGGFTTNNNQSTNPVSGFVGSMTNAGLAMTAATNALGSEFASFDTLKGSLSSIANPGSVDDGGGGSGFDYTIGAPITLASGAVIPAMRVSLNYGAGANFKGVLETMRKLWVWLLCLGFLGKVVWDITGFLKVVVMTKGSLIPDLEFNLEGFTFGGGGNMAGVLMFVFIVAAGMLLYAAALVGMFAAVYGDVSWSSIISYASVHPLAGANTGGLSLLSACFPVSLFFSLISAFLTWRMTVNKLAIVLIAAARFIPGW